MRFLVKYNFICLGIPENEAGASEQYVMVHMEGDSPVDEYVLHDPQQQEEPVIEVKGAPVEEPPAVLNEVAPEEEPLPAVEQQPIAEPQKFTYASIVYIFPVADTSHQFLFIFIYLFSVHPSLPSNDKISQSNLLFSLYFAIL